MKIKEAGGGLKNDSRGSLTCCSAERSGFTQSDRENGAKPFPTERGKQGKHKSSDKLTRHASRKRNREILLKKN